MELTEVITAFSKRYDTTLHRIEILKKTASNDFERQKLIDSIQELDLLNEIIQSTTTLEEFISERQTKL